MATVTGVIGQDNVELDNAASEETLRRLLAATNALNQSILRMGSGGGGGNNPGSAQTVQQTNALNQGLQRLSTGGVSAASVALNGLATTIGTVAKGIGALGGVIAGLGGAMSGLASKMLDGEGKVSDFYESLSGIPIVGMFAGMFAKIAALQEAELETYRKLTAAGINFGGQLTDLRQNALGLGLTLDQFSDILTHNSKSLAKLGGTADEGATRFVELAKDLRNSNVGQELRALGLNSQQVTSGLAGYLQVSGARNASEMSNSKALIASAGEYMKQLDSLAQITGETKEEQEKALKEANANAAYEAYLQTLDEEGRKKATLAMQNALAVGGKAGADVLKSQLLGLPPMTEAAQHLTALGPEVANGIKKMGSAVNTTGATIKDVNKGFDQARAGANVVADRFKNVSGALSFGSDGVSQSLMALQASANRNTAQGIKNENDAAAQRERITADQDARSRSAAGAAAESEKAFKDVGAAIYGALAPALKILTPMVNDMATQFMGFIKNNMPMIRDALTSMVVVITDFGKNLMSQEGRDKIMNDISYYFKLMLIDIKLAAIPWYSESDAKADRAKLDADKQRIDKDAEIKRSQMANSDKLAALKIASDAKERAKIETQIANDTAAIDNLKKQKNLTADQEKTLNELQESVNKNQNLMKLAGNKTEMTGAAGLSKQNMLDKIINIESGGNSKAQAPTSSAFGLGQFTKGTFEDLAKRKDSKVYGKTWEEYKGSADIQRAALEDLTDRNQAYLGSQGIAQTGAATYLAHFLGAGGVSKLFKAGNDADIMSVIDRRAYMANKSIFDQAKTVGGLKKWAARKMGEDETSALQASEGGFFAGPQSGYNVQLHGKELVVPMNNDTQVSKSAISPGSMTQEGATNSALESSSMVSGPKSVDLLLAELQTLNKSTEEMIKWHREAADQMRRNVDATKSLSGNLFA